MLTISSARIAKGKLTALSQVLWAAILLFGVAGRGLAQPNGVYREVWNGLSSSSLLSMTNNTVLLNPPVATEILTNYFEGPYNYAEGFGDRFRALLIPPVSGTYVFWVQGDDAGVLYLSTDMSAENKQEIAINTSTALYRAWYEYPSQQSTNIFLQAGRRYYIEALHSAGTGDDSFAVGWKIPDGTLEQPIPVSRLVPFGMPAKGSPSLSQHPANVSVAENSPATFWVAVTNLDAVTYQWQRNGVNLPFANAASYSLPSVSTADNGAKFRCIVSNSFGAVTSSEGTLAVLTDATRPTLTSAANIGNGTIQVLFSEPVEAATATNAANYGLSGGVTISSAKFVAGSTRAVELTTGPLTYGNIHIISVSNVRDRAGTPNTILANSQMAFPVLLKGVYRQIYTNIAGSAVLDLTNSSIFPNNPHLAELMTGPLETKSYQYNHYGQRLRARILPPLTGSYTFWLAAGSSGALFLGTNDTPGSARQIASVNELTMVSPHQWDGQTNQRSAPITLTAGQQYYIEVWMKAGISEGFPPDHLALRWQLPDGTVEELIPALRFTPVGMSLPSLTQVPLSTTVMEGASATFSVAVSNLEAVTYQWQQNGTNIPGATNSTYVASVVTLSQNNFTYRCLVSNGIGTTTSSAATLWVIADGLAPTVVNAFNQGSNRVLVVYSEPIEAASATNTLNYSISGVTVTNAVLQGDNRSVMLGTTALQTGSNYVITINGVKDQASTPNTIAPNTQWVFAASDFYPQDIGGSAVAGSYSQPNGGVQVVASGSGLGSASDQFHFSYQQRRGDFDLKIRVQRLDFADTWSFAGLMVKDDLSTNGRFAGVLSTPSINGTFFEYRTNAGTAPEITGSFPANYPYTWLRLQRSNGVTFTGYASYDGLTWKQLGTVMLAFPQTVYIGLAVSSRDPSKSTTAEFYDFADASEDTIGTFTPDVEPLGPSTRRTGLVITELMYHPADRTDGRKLEFVELYNSNPVPEDISGFRLSGEIDYTFPQGTSIAGGAFLVIARNPADIQAVYNIPNVIGPYTGSFPNDKGTLRLRNRQDAILLEINYDSKAPWPPGPDGTGHSLVLAKPSWGEDHPDAWAQSDRFGGSPGKVDGYGWEPGRNVVINEFLAHTDFPEVDFVELYNHGQTTVDLSGCWLTDDPSTNKYRIPNGTIIAPTGFVYFTETTLGFGFSAGGESLYLINSNLTRVLDCVSFEAQENGVSSGRYPDGAPKISRLASKTPGLANSGLRADNIVINEIMYNPVTGDDNDEFIELYNRGPGSVNLSGWRFVDGIDFTFPTNTVIASNSYMVVAKNVTKMLSNNYGSYLNATNLVGNFIGTLANGGERVALAMPDTIISTNANGVVSTNTIYIVKDEVLYGTGGKWGKWSDGGGSSLELMDPRSDNRLPSNWADSDDTSKSSFTTLTVTGPFDNAGGGDWDSLQIFMLDAGECLIDQVNVQYPPIYQSANLVTNGGFESGMNFWFAQGNHRATYIENSGASGSKSLHVVAEDRGDTGANRIYTTLNGEYSTNGTGTISAQVRWLRGPPYIIFRLRGNHLELAGTLTVPKNLGSPGKVNSRFVANRGPAITEVAHSPILPTAGQPVVVTARVHDPDGVNSVQLVWRVDPSFGNPSTTVTMVDNGTGNDAVGGDGVYTATIPGQPLDTMVAFYVQATDSYSTPATLRFPITAPTNECLVRFGEAQPISTFGTYRFWMTEATKNAWSLREKLSSEVFKGTFVLGNYRVMYDAGSHYAGSPAHTKLYDGPMGTNCDYQLILSKDDALLNETSIRVQEPGLVGKDATCQAEQFSYWLINQLGLPALNRRSVNIYVNGLKRGRIYEDTQRQNKSFDEQWFPDAIQELSDLYRIGYWYEFSNDTLSRDDQIPSLQNFTTSGGAKKLARYRMTFNKRAIQTTPHDYTNLFNLVDLLNTTATGEEYAARVYPQVDIKGWARAFAAERILNNTDLYGATRYNGPETKPGAQNSFIVRPGGDTWKFLIWDIDAAFLGLPTDPLFDFTDPPITQLFSQPAVLRHYWQALEEAAYGPLQPHRMYPIMDAKYTAYQSSGVAAGPPDGMKEFLNIRRDYIIELINTVRANFSLTVNGGLDFTNNSTVVTLTGVAPIQAHKIRINGVNYPLSWSTITNWSVQLVISGQTNVFTVQGYDFNGNLLSNATRTITVYYNGPISKPEDSLVINEIMFNPAVSNASYVEIYNRSTNTTFDLWNYRLDGVDFNFKPGAFLGPQSYMVVVQDEAAFKSAYGTNAAIAGAFKGSLDKDGESIKLIKQAPTTNEVDTLIDRVKYETRAPWPTKPAVANGGASVQLIDAAQDNARVSNWGDGDAWQFYSFTAKPNSANSSKIYFYFMTPGEVYLDDIRFVLGTEPGVGSNYVRNGSFESSLSGNWALGTAVSSSQITNGFAKVGTNSLRLVQTSAGGTSSSANMQQDFSDYDFDTGSFYTLSFWYRPSGGAGNTNLVVKFGSSSGPSNVVTVGGFRGTPGQLNSVAGTVNPYPLLWINEVQPNNQTGLQDNTGTPQPWIELFNSSTNTISLDGLYLSRSYTNLTEWAFPTGSVVLPGQFRIIFADGQPQLSTGSVLHTSFRLSPTNGSLALSRGQQILDYVNYTNMSADLSYGSYPDGQLFDRQLFYFVTPGASNNPAAVPVVINEWMASNTKTLINPLKSRYDDWIELYNFGSTPIDLGGFYLTDNLSNKKKFRIPNGFIVPAGGFGFCWADNDTSLTNMSGNAIHANFAISKSGGSLGLYDPAGIKVDSVTFGAQTSDVSEGRYKDGNVGGGIYSMILPTPGTTNVVTNNLYAPVLSTIADTNVNEGALLAFTVQATDNDFPVQQLTYTLLPGAPEGAALDPVTGGFSWTPGELQGGVAYTMSVRVSDNGVPPQTDTKTFQVTVNEVNSAPIIASIANRSASPNTNLSLSIPGSDSDLPAQTLTYQLVAGPNGASVSGAGLFSWTPTPAQGSSTNTIIVKVTDNGSPALSATQTFLVTVSAANLCSGYYGDVAPRSGVDGDVTIADWVQVGRFAAVLDVPTNACELLKGDCAPKNAPDGSLTIADWVQAGRYAARLDPLVAVGSSSFAPTKSQSTPKAVAAKNETSTSRQIRVENMAVERGKTNILKILLNAQGDESSISFSLDYDPSILRYVSSSLGSGAISTEEEMATWQRNLSGTNSGRIAFALILNSGQVFNAGTQEMVRVRFEALPGTGFETTTVGLVEEPIPVLAVDAFANELPVTMADGIVVVTSGNMASLESINILDGGQVRLRFMGSVGTWELQASPDLQNWEKVADLQNTTGILEYIETNPPSGGQRFYRAVKQTP